MVFNPHKPSMVHIDVSGAFYMIASGLRVEMMHEERTYITDLERENIPFDCVKLFQQIANNFNASKVMLHYDGIRDDIWRRKINPLYKLLRNYKKQTSAPQMRDVCYNVAISEIKKTTPMIKTLAEFSKFTNVDIKHLEADDSAFLSVHRWKDDYNHYLITKDGDWVQNKMYCENVFIHGFDKSTHSKSNIFNEVINIKLISGDMKDGVPHICSIKTFHPLFEDMIYQHFLKQGQVIENVPNFLNNLKPDVLRKLKDVFYKQHKEPPYSYTNKRRINKTLYKNLTLEELDNWVLTYFADSDYKEEIYKNYQLNKQMLLFPYIPKELQQEIYKIELA